MRRELEIRSGDGLPIRAIVEIPDRPRGLVLIVHGFKGFKEWGFFPWIAERLVSAGAAAVRFDMSRAGIGDRPGELDRLDLFAENTYTTELSDLERVLEAARALDEVRGLPVFLFGHSRGGGIAILAAARDPQIRGVITWSSIARVDRWPSPVKRQWRESGELVIANARTGQQMPMSTAILRDVEQNGRSLDILGAISRLTVPALIVHGLADESVPDVESRELTARARNASLLLIQSATHTYGAKHPFEGPTRELSYAMHATCGFLNAYCRTTRIVSHE